jgi:RNA polymerase sigma factor (sigma-70 family)
MPRWSPLDAAVGRRLVQRLNDGDESALVALIDAYAERLYDYALSMTGEYKVAADITHDTFIDATRRAPRMRDHQRLRAWLYAAVRRRCVQRARSRVLFWEPDVEFGDEAAAVLAGGGASTKSVKGRARARQARSVRRTVVRSVPSLRGVRPRSIAHACRSGQGSGGRAQNQERPVPGWDATDVDAGESARALPPSAELRRLLEASMERLPFGDQEAVLLAVRHGLRAPEIGAVLGVSSRRAASRVSRSTTLLDEACEIELTLAEERCAARSRKPSAENGNGSLDVDGTAGGVDGRVSRTHDSGGREQGEHVPDADAFIRAPQEGNQRQEASGLQASSVGRAASDGVPEHQHWRCGDCERRAEMRATALLAAVPPPAFPAALRHRVLHTATDPELAGYRADIAARGGALTPDGLPTQPDMPSPFTKRWLFAGGGMAGAMITALIGAMLMGPGLGGGPIYWPPFGARPQPSVTDGVQERPHGRGGEPETPPERPSDPPSSERAPVSPQGRDTIRPEPSPQPSSPRPGPGTLVVTPAKVELYTTKSGTVRLTASNGPVSWKATSSSSQVSVSRSAGELSEGGSAQVTLTLATNLINLPGEAKVTFTDRRTGAERQVTVVWGVSLL